MTATGEGPGDLPTDPDDINSRLAEVAAELTSRAKFTEPKAADRARVPVGTAGAHAARGPRQRRRTERLAAELRKPVQSAHWSSPTGSGQPWRRRVARLNPGRALSRWEYRRRSARPQPVPDRGYASPSYRSPHQSLAILLAAIVILIALCFLVLSFLGRP
jgi:hypothetical protein